MSNTTITNEQRELAADMGCDICESCGTEYTPAPGFINDGHQCNESGTAPEFELEVTAETQRELGVPREYWEENIASFRKGHLERLKGSPRYNEFAERYAVA